MKVGSIVVVLPIPAELVARYRNITWLPVQDENTPYMIRGLNRNRSAYLEEGVIGYYNGKEIAIGLEYLREIQPPMDLEEIMEAVNAEPLEV